MKTGGTSLTRQLTDEDWEKIREEIKQRLSTAIKEIVVDVVTKYISPEARDLSKLLGARASEFMKMIDDIAEDNVLPLIELIEEYFL